MKKIKKDARINKDILDNYIKSFLIVRFHNRAFNWW